MKKATIYATAIVLSLALTGCGKALKEENAQLKEQVTQLTELNNSLTAEKQNLETQLADMTVKVSGLEAEMTTIKEQRDAKMKARPVPGKKKS